MARHTRASADTLKGGVGVLYLSGDDPWMARHTRASVDTLKGGVGVLHLSRDDPWMAIGN